MKKTIITIAIILGITIGASAQNRGLFGLGPEREESYDTHDRTSSGGLLLPQSHGSGQDQDGAPLGGGALLLIGFGAAYVLKKKHRE